LNPLVALLPRYLFAAALTAQFVALVVPLAALADVARGLLGTAVLVGLIALAVLVVDHTTAPVGSVMRRLRGLACAWTSAMTVGFTLAWHVFAQAAPASVFALELVAFAGGLYGYREALRVEPVLAQDGDEGEEGPLAWPVRPAR
jgi:hypothetical protein